MTVRNPPPCIRRRAPSKLPSSRTIRAPRSTPSRGTRPGTPSSRCYPRSDYPATPAAAPAERHLSDPTPERNTASTPRTPPRCTPGTHRRGGSSISPPRTGPCSRGSAAPLPARRSRLVRVDRSTQRGQPPRRPCPPRRSCTARCTPGTPRGPSPCTPRCPRSSSGPFCKNCSTLPLRRPSGRSKSGLGRSARQAPLLSSDHHPRRPKPPSRAE
mmetsp:Transcript_12273/g.36014  ORF Transcript_12273/g.36014 Transcript_12273/m.36014 type:complete len:214 (-) Transcript_12273:895-1536(-)